MDEEEEADGPQSPRLAYYGGRLGEQPVQHSQFPSPPSSPTPSTPLLSRNMAAFWLLGLCNNFAYVVMLSAAKDILEKGDGGGAAPPPPHDNGTCVNDVSTLPCPAISTGAVLLADIIPSLGIKLLAPFTLQSVSYSRRHLFVVAFQVSSFLLVALSDQLPLALLGVVFASLGSGLGEVSYLSLSSHFHADAVSSWSSGTGGAGIVGSLAFAALTDRNLLDLRPRTSLLLMLIVPAALFATYEWLLQSPDTIRKAPWACARGRQGRRRTRQLTANADGRSSSPSPPTRNSRRSGSREPLLISVQPAPLHSGYRTGELQCLHDNWVMVKPLLKFMLPLLLVYLAEYFINQGLIELLVFPCASGLQLSPSSQYRWHQVLYQLGVFISRSSVKACPIRASLLPVLTALQVLNVFALFTEAVVPYLPHIALLFGVVLYEGLLGGAAYANTFNAVHKTVPRAQREFSMGFVAMSDSMGIVMAGFLAIRAHNSICDYRRR